jgi:hypothetical protein
MGEPGRTYLPATGNHWSLPLYDPLVRLLGADAPDAKSADRLSRWLHSGHRLKDNSDEQILSLMRQAGLADPMRLAERTMLVGHIAYYQASAPTSLS